MNAEENVVNPEEHYTEGNSGTIRQHILQAGAEIGGEIYDKTQQAATEMYDKTQQAAHDAYGKTKEVASDTYGKTKEVASDTYGKTKEVASDTYDRARAFARDNPGKAALIAMGVGVGLGMFLCSRQSSASGSTHGLVDTLSDVARAFLR
jgi:ElaB/YqjD/DUF883 family membrane-anchored ribosome-binding protein